MSAVRLLASVVIAVAVTGAVACESVIDLGRYKLPEGAPDAAPDTTPDAARDATPSSCPSPPGGGTCDVFPTCGCLADQTCARINGAPEQCVPAGKQAALGDCVDATECQQGLLCANGVCDPPCSESVQCEANYDCIAQYHDTTEALGYSICEPHCNPLESTTTDATHASCGPSSGQRCDAVAMGGHPICTYSTTVGTGVQGGACTTNENCAPGFWCGQPAGQTAYCQRYCLPGVDGGASGCSSGLHCDASTHYDGAVLLGGCVE